MVPKGGFSMSFRETPALPSFDFRLTMGADVCIYMKIKDLRQMICKNEDFCLMMELVSRTAGLRWDAFLNTFGLDCYKTNTTKLTSKDLTKLLGNYNGSLLDRESCSRLLSTYEIIFIPDNEEFENSDYIELLDFAYCVEDVVCSQFDDIVKKCDTYHVKDR